MSIPPAGAVLSPDGYYWWDGTTWQTVDRGDSPSEQSASQADRRPTPPSIEVVSGQAWDPSTTVRPSAPGHRPGFFQRRRNAKAEKAYKAAWDVWQGRLTEARALLELVETFGGLASADGIILKPRELVFGRLDGAALMEERVTGGHWESRSQGVSIPIARIGGRSVRYHVSQSRGHYVKGQPIPTAIDRGVAFITSQRVLFTGARQTRECLFAKLVGFQHGAGATALSVSNRQKPTVIHYGVDLQDWFLPRFALALAHFQGTVGQLVAEMRGLVTEIENSPPACPAVTG